MVVSSTLLSLVVDLATTKLSIFTPIKNNILASDLVLIFQVGGIQWSEIGETSLV